MHDTPEAPDHIDYAQSASGVYEQRSIRETVYIRVINTPEARADYNFGDEPGFNWLNIEAVLPGTRVPVDIDITNTGNDPSLYNYGHDVQVRFYVDDNPTLIQDQVTLTWESGDVQALYNNEVTIRGHVTLNNPSEYVRAFIEVRTINPHTDDYIDNSIRRPALEELNWDNNNVTTDDTADGLPQMVRLRPATSVASFAPGLMAVSLVGAFVGAIPPMIGWVAVRGQLDLGAWILGAILFLWQLPHFLSLAWIYRDQYEGAGFRMLPSAAGGDRPSREAALLSCLLLIPLALLMVTLQLAGTVYAACAIILGLGFAWKAVRFYRTPSRDTARSLFLTSLLYLPLILLAMVLDRIPLPDELFLYIEPSLP